MSDIPTSNQFQEALTKNAKASGALIENTPNPAGATIPGAVITPAQPKAPTGGGQ